MDLLANLAKSHSQSLFGLFLVLNITVVTLIVFSLNSPNWVRSDSDEKISYMACSTCDTKTFDFDSFIGQLRYYSDNYTQSESYDDIKDIICANRDYEQNKEEKYKIEALCNTLDALYIAGYAKGSLDSAVIGLMSCVLIFTCMVIFMPCKHFFYFNCFFSLSASILYFVGSIFWFCYTSSSFVNCDKKISSDGEKIILCAKDGPILVIIIMIIIFLTLVSFFTIGLKSIKENLNEGRLQYHSEYPRNQTEVIRIVPVVNNLEPKENFNYSENPNRDPRNLESMEENGICNKGSESHNRVEYQNCEIQDLDG